MSGLNVVKFSSNVNFHDKLYIWSLITEPFLFFIFLSSNVLGFPITLSRTLQVLFLFILAVKYLKNRKISFDVNFLSTNYQRIYIFIFLLLFSTVVGFISGAYVYEIEIHKYGYDKLKEIMLLSHFSRPLFEFFLTIYYFIYFLILPKYILCTGSHINYLMKWIKNACVFVVAIGLFDVLFNIVGFDLIPRHLVDSRWVTMGIRFHSILGEPRDAFVYLLFMISVFYLYAGVSNIKPPNILGILFIFLSLVLTQSFSGFIGIAFSFILFITFTRLPLEYYKTTMSVIFLSLFLGFVISEFSVRTNIYMDMVVAIPKILQAGSISPYLVGVHYPTDIIHAKYLATLVMAQSPDIIPLWVFFNKIFSMDFFTVIFGGGVGSASFETNNFINSFGVNNPRGQITRLLFESGVIGAYVYMLILITPIYKLKFLVSQKFYLRIMIISIFLYGAVLAHRSNLGLIFAGVMLSIIRVKIKTVLYTNENSFSKNNVK